MYSSSVQFTSWLDRLWSVHFCSPLVPFELAFCTTQDGVAHQRVGGFAIRFMEAFLLVFSLVNRHHVAGGDVRGRDTTMYIVLSKSSL